MPRSGWAVICMEQKYITTSELFGALPNEQKAEALASELEKIPAVSERARKIMEIKNAQGRAESLAGLYLLSQMTDLSSKELIYPEGEKPYLLGGPEFSISHSHGFAVCVTDESPVGVDTELLRRIADAERLAKRYFSDKEKEKMLSFADQNEAFLRIWTKKEALFKLGGDPKITDIRKVDTESANAIFEESTVTIGGKTYLITVCRNQ